MVQFSFAGPPCIRTRVSSGGHVTCLPALREKPHYSTSTCRLSSGTTRLLATTTGQRRRQRHRELSCQADHIDLGFSSRPVAAADWTHIAFSAKTDHLRRQLARSWRRRACRGAPLRLCNCITLEC